MTMPSKQLDAYQGTVQNAMKRQDYAALMSQAEELMQFHQTDVDEDKVQAAALLDEIAAFLMGAKEFAQARVVIIGSLRVKGTLSKESGLTTFSYQQLEECEHAADASVKEIARQSKGPSSKSSKLLIAIAVLALASACAVFLLVVK